MNGVPQPFRVLSLDGGGMRGIYTAQYLASVSDGFSRRLKKLRLDIGKGFDLIVGTSTGAIVACALAAAVPMQDVVNLYRQHGKFIFPRRLPTGLGLPLIADLLKRPAALRQGSAALQRALSPCFKSENLGQLYQRRNIALAVTAVNMSNHKSWVFKTPHLARSNHRDDLYTLVDVCLASSAAPIFRSVAAIDFPDGQSGYHAFIDGGLWANNPVLVALIEALDLAPPDQQIEVFSVGTCPRPAGTAIRQTEVHRGLLEWKFGGEAASMAIDAQEFAFDQMAKFLVKHPSRNCHIVRFPSEPVPATMMQYLDLDDTRDEAAEAILQQARTDADMANSKCANPNNSDGMRVCALFESMPERPETTDERAEVKHV
jgi:uncharacterized protein